MLRVGQEVEEPKEPPVLEVQAGEVSRKTANYVQWLLKDTEGDQMLCYKYHLVEIESNK